MKVRGVMAILLIVMIAASYVISAGTAADEGNESPGFFERTWDSIAGAFSMNGAISGNAIWDSFANIFSSKEERAARSAVGICEARAGDFIFNIGGSLLNAPQVSRQACDNILREDHPVIEKSVCLNSAEDGNVEVTFDGEIIDSFSINCDSIAYDEEEKCSVEGELELMIEENFESGISKYQYSLSSPRGNYMVSLQEEKDYDHPLGKVKAKGVARGKKFIVMDETELDSSSSPLCPTQAPVPEGYESTPIVAESTSSIPVYHSKPGANQVIYLDFDGHTTSGTNWDLYYNDGQPIVTPPFDLDGDPTTFSETELEKFYITWDGVREDYAPFDVDVTTEEPPLEDLMRSGSADTKWGVRVVIGPNTGWYAHSGGVAYVGSFRSSIDLPVFVFSNALYSSATYMLDAASHEAGHALGLYHQRQLSSNMQVEAGYCLGGNGWAPIMGNSYHEAVSTWHDGDGREGCFDPERTDIDIIVGQNGSTSNGFTFRVDDVGDTAATATELLPMGSTIFATGLISETQDVDVYSFVTEAGAISIDVYRESTFIKKTNLYGKVELRDGQDNLIAESLGGEQGFVAGSINASVPAGEYFLYVMSEGDYGDLGRYAITGQIAANIPCSARTPTLELQPQQQVGSAGDTLAYTLIVNNVDVGSCPERSFEIDFSSPFLSANVIPSTPMIAPGASAEVDVFVISPPTTPAAAYPFYLSTSSTSITGEYVVADCTYQQPSISISPVSTGGGFGDSVTYSVSVQNTNTAYCSPTMFTLESVLPAGFSGSFSKSSGSLASGEFMNSDLIVTSSVDSTEGSNPILVRVRGVNAVHENTIQASYIIDSIAPSAPTNLVAAKSGKTVTLTWGASSDDVGVVRYDVYKDGNFIASTSYTTLIAPGRFGTYYVVAFDSAGNPSEPSNLAGKNVDDGTTTEPTITKCSDGRDNDRDGTCDFDGCTAKVKGRQTILPPDAGCTSASDDSE